MIHIALELVMIDTYKPSRDSASSLVHSSTDLEGVVALVGCAPANHSIKTSSFVDAATDAEGLSSQTREVLLTPLDGLPTIPAETWGRYRGLAYSDRRQSEDVFSFKFPRGTNKFIHAVFVFDLNFANPAHHNK